MTLIPTHGLLAIFGEAATLERPGATTLNDFGEAATAAPTSTSITVQTHPMPGEDIERLDLDRKHAWRVFDSDTVLQLGGDTTSPDVIVYAGERWQLQKIDDYQTHGGLTGAVGMRIE